jgi:hypothetical protein
LQVKAEGVATCCVCPKAREMPVVAGDSLIEATAEVFNP